MFYYKIFKQEDNDVLSTPFDKYEAKLGDVLKKSIEQFVAGSGFHCMRNPSHTKEIPISVCERYVICEVEILGKLDWDGGKGVSTDKIKLIRVIDKDEVIENTHDEVHNGVSYHFVNGICKGEYMIEHMGAKHWFKDCVLHRGDDLPAAIYSNGDMEWYQEGEIHRDTVDPETGLVNPAGIYVDGERWWYKCGKQHSYNDQPGVIYKDGEKRWYKDDVLYRGDDKPAIIKANGMQVWFVNGKSGREDDKPAVVYPSGSKEWWWNYQLHRETVDPETGELNPAVITINKWTGKRCYEWWINGKRVKDDEIKK